MPKISVIMPAYNAEKYLKEAIDSILTQTFADFELIVINDCSKDATEQIILSYDDSRVVYLKNEQNLGVAGTLNRGLSVAQGEYVARMDADDISEPQRLQVQLKFLEAHPQVVMCGSHVTVFFDTGEQRVCYYPTNDGQIRAVLLFACPFAHPSVMLRTNVLRDHGLHYDEEFEKVEDYRLWTKLAEYGKLANLPEPLLRYRKHPQQVCATSPQAQYEGKVRLAAYLLPMCGVQEPEEQRLIVDAFDGRVTEKQAFARFIDLAKRMQNCASPEVDKAFLRATLKSRIIEIALANKIGLPFGSMNLVGAKAWIYVNLGRKK